MFILQKFAPLLLKHPSRVTIRGFFDLSAPFDQRSNMHYSVIYKELMQFMPFLHLEVTSKASARDFLSSPLKKFSRSRE